MKRSKKLLFIIIPSLVVFFALSFLLTSARQKELNTEIISTDTTITKGIADDMNKTMSDIRSDITSGNKDYNAKNRGEVVCGGVTITEGADHGYVGSAWLHKCVAYTPWKCSANVEGPRAGGCEDLVQRATDATWRAGKHTGSVLIKWECPEVKGVYCARSIKYAIKNSTGTYGESGTTCSKDKKTGKISCTNYCASSYGVAVCGNPASTKTFGSPQCFDGSSKTGFKEAVKNVLNPDNNINSDDIKYVECEPYVRELDCSATSLGCNGTAGGVNADIISYQNCCGNVCQGCTRECANHPPVVEPINGETFTASSSKGSVPAYCINQHLLMPDNGKFMWDSSFNVTACKDSNSSKDCGYGYILLKSYALGYDYAVTNVALRLWAASDNHGAAAGYDDSPGVPVSETRGFVEPHWNVYKQTAKEINIRRYIKYVNSKGTDFKNDVFKGSYKTVKKLSDLQGISCNGFNPIPNDSIAHSTGENMGILCTGVNEEYLKSIYLYILALQGNKIPIDEVYRKHLSNKCKTDSSFKSKNKELCANPDEATIDVGDYTNRNYIPVSAKVTYIDPESFETTIKFTMSEEVDVECSADELATANYCKTNVEITDSNGNVVKADHYDECKKNICYIKVKGMKTCNKDTVGQTKKITIKVITDKVYGDLAVKKMVACDSPGSNQIFFALDLDNALTNTGDPKVDHRDVTEQTVTITCPCEPTNKCMNDDIIDRLNRKNTKSNLNATCETKDGGTGEYDTYEDNSLEDPNMNCIINMCYDGQQSQYDYSEKYGVNNKYCTLYCRDEVRFYLANKTKVYTGMQFRYDVGTKLKNKGIIKQQIDTNDVKYLTSVVRQERHCTSVIDYKTWKADYDKASSLDKEQLIYDIENCNLYDINKINVKKYYEDAKVIENGNSRTGYTTVDYIQKTLKCQMDASGEDSCADLELEYKSKYNGDGTNTFAKDEGQVISEVKYCSGSECYQYKCPSKAKDYNTRLKECNEWSKTTQAEFDPDGENITTIINGVAVPKNDYAAIVISSEVDFSNPIKYQTKAFTGDVKRVENDKVEDMYTPLGKNVYPVELNQRTFVNNPNDEENWKFVKHYYKFRLLVDRPNRAMEKYLGLLGNEQGHQFDYNYTCNFDVYNKSTDYSCDPEANYNKCYEISADGVVTFHDSFKDENGNEVACSKECVQSGGYGFIFRNVQLDNMFPSEAVRDTGNNWTTDKAKEAIKEIEASADKMYTTDDYLEYSYTITPEAIKSIKDYNKQEESSGGYQNSTLYGCESSKTNVSAFENCKSKFLEEIGKDETVLGMNITAHKSNGISKYTQNKNKTTISVGE